jgi:hypothetical protein
MIAGMPRRELFNRDFDIGNDAAVEATFLWIAEHTGLLLFCAMARQSPRLLRCVDRELRVI